MSDSINGNLAERAFADTTRMEWTQSPSGTVWRKRVHLVGPVESGQVTSVVRYEPSSHFHAHDHPDGEEILVLDGVFSDEHGDWPAGTYLLNPEGFRHAPHSEPGCTLFVKLRQFAGRDRQHVVVDTGALRWDPSELPGIGQKPLYRQPGYSDVVRLEHWPADGEITELSFPEGAEIFILDGDLIEAGQTYRAGCWLRFPVRDRARLRSASGCTLYAKRGGVAYLRQGD